jgi:isopenicillin-N N-acyltransferase-like protein
MKPFPLIEIRPGSPREMGIQYGRLAREKILAGIEDYRLLFAEIGAMSWENMRKYASSFFAEANEEFPEIAAEVEGIAEGAEVERDDVMVLNCRYEITKFPGEKEMNEEADPNECTSFAVLPEATEKENGRGKTYVGQNWDYRAGIIDNVVVLHIQQPDGTRILGLAEAGQVIRNGFNSHGIGLCANNLQSTLDRKGVGIPVTFLRRKILSSRSLAEAFSLVLKTKRKVSVNFMIASSEGRAADLEAFPGGADVLEPKDGIVAHANHFVADPSKNVLETSPRGECLEDLLRQKRGHIDVPYLIRCLSDHENYPKAICRHPADVTIRLGRRSITVAGVIYDLGAGVAHVCAGPSCEGAFVVHTL